MFSNPVLMYSSFSRYRLHSKFIYTWCYFQAFNSSLYILYWTATTSHHNCIFLDHLHESFWFFIIFNEQTQFNLLYVPHILWNVIEFVKQIYNICKYGNMRECYMYQTFLIYKLHFLEKCNINKLILQSVQSI